MRPDSNLLFIIDAGVITLVSLSICLASHHLLFMSLFVPGIILIRLMLVAAVAAREGVNLKAEVLFLVLCTILGALNDWNSVCHKQIYTYAVPHYFHFSTIPVWMLLFWGMILRFIARLARWQGLRPGTEISNRVGISAWQADHGALKILFELLLVFLTRQAIYRYHADPMLSWLPFMVALGLFLLFSRPDRHDFKLLFIFLLGGPLIEVLYIQVGGLHSYELGWIGGVPLWIVLWWVLVVLIWKDLAFRIEKALRTRQGDQRNSPSMSQSPVSQSSSSSGGARLNR